MKHLIYIATCLLFVMCTSMKCEDSFLDTQSFLIMNETDSTIYYLESYTVRDAKDFEEADSSSAQMYSRFAESLFHIPPHTPAMFRLYYDKDVDENALCYLFIYKQSTIDRYSPDELSTRELHDQRFLIDRKAMAQSGYKIVIK